MIEVGSEVTFTARGRKLTGVVTDFKYREHRKANRIASAWTGGGMRVPDTKMAVIKVDGMDTGYYTAPVSMLKETGRNRSGELTGARDVVNSIANKRARNQQDRQDRGREMADTQGLYRLTAGDKVEVKYRQGWLECEFIKLSGMGRVLVKNPIGREQWIATHLVRVPGQGADSTPTD